MPGGGEGCTEWHFDRCLIIEGAQEVPLCASRSAYRGTRRATRYVPSCAAFVGKSSRIGYRQKDGKSCRSRIRFMSESNRPPGSGTGCPRGYPRFRGAALSGMVPP